ncbi:TGM2 glutamyltransferase, partial [Nothoprocta ornata]|nr:TGM2 glutamyltransferase [Nothoprocta ornata]
AELVLETCDLQCESNGQQHRTAAMGCRQLVVRRGQPFGLTLRFAGRGYEEGLDKLSFNVETGPCPSESSGTKCHFAVSDCPEEASWSAVLQEQDGASLSLSLCSPPAARIGRYRLTLEAATDYQGTSFSLGDFVLLFNPWHPEDTVFLRDEDERSEYVLSQQGLIYQGARDYITATPWNFGQVTRMDPSCPPASRPMPAVLRCLGIASRVVTNYNSAHDTNGNLVIDRYLSETGEAERRSKDSIWNYHCWVEAWMRRPDLAPGYEGWQALDPTPQERSEGVFCCGPAPVKAVKEGDLQLKYDTPFVFAEVNADVVYWIVGPDGSERKSTHTSIVGKNISTKSVGRDTREDITHHYKYPEGSDKEREVFAKAELEKSSVQEEDEGLHLRIKLTEGANNGCDFDVLAVIHNNTDAERVCRLMICARTASYNGTAGPQCGMKDLLNVALEPRAEKRVPLRVLYEQYGAHLTQDKLIKVVALLTDRESGETLLAVRDVYVENPQIRIRV